MTIFKDIIEKKMTFIYLHLKCYPSPKNLSYFWSFGFFLGICLATQIISGFFLSIFYKPTYLDAFASVEHTIMKDVYFGWLIRYAHSNMASFFFATAYIHMGKALYYQSFYKKKVWFSGLVIFILLILEAFTGYVLPWGQMSYWAATVITNFLTIIPLVGKFAVEFVWGGFTVCEQTLKRFFSVHFILGLAIGALALIHIILLHDLGSSGTKNENVHSKTYFITIFSEEIIFSAFVFMVIVFYVIFFKPLVFMHPANFEQANPLQTPEHIVPEWYLLPFYTILRVTPGKTEGILLMGASLIVLFLLPFLSPTNSKSWHWKFFYWTFINQVLCLGYLGGCPADPIYIQYGRFSAFYYFFFLCFLVPAYKYIWSAQQEKNNI